MNVSIRRGSSRTTSRALSVVAGTLLAGLLALPGNVRGEQGALTQLPSLEGCIRQGGSGPCTDGDLLHGAFGVAVSNDGKNAYAALIDSHAVAVLARDKKTGALSQLPSPQGCFSDGGTIARCTPGRGLIAPLAVAVSPDGKNVYFVSFQTDPVSISAVAVFARDTKTGALTQLPGTQGCISEDIGGGVCADGIAIRGAMSVAVSKDGAHVYVASLVGAVAVFARDKKTGALTQLPEPQGCVSKDGSGGHCTQGVALEEPTSVAISNDGKHVYVASRRSQGVAAFARNKRTGALTQLPGKAGCISEDDNAGDCTDGVGLHVPNSIAVSPRGKQVYVASTSGQVAVLARDKKTGALSQLPAPHGCISEDGSGGLCTDGVALRQAYAVAVSPDAKQVYVAVRDDHAVAVFAQDKKSGRLSQLPSSDACISDGGSGGLCTAGRALRDPRSVAVSKDGKHVYVASQGSDAVAVLQREK